MIADAIKSVLGDFWAQIVERWSDLWSPIFDGWPLWWSYGVFGLILLGCFAIGFFLQFKWARLALGVVVLAAGAWLTGRVTMYGEMKEKLDAERKKRKR